MSLLLALLALVAEGPPADLAAVGVIVSPRPEFSVALLRSGGRTRASSVGETAFGGRLTAITADRVSIDFGERRLELRISGGPSETAAGPRAAAPPAESSDDPPAR